MYICIQHMHRFAYARVHTHTRAHTHACAHTHAHSLTHTHTHTHTRAHTHKYTSIHAYTQTLPLIHTILGQSLHSTYITLTIIQMNHTDLTGLF